MVCAGQSVFGEPALGVDRGRTAAARGGDGLPVGVVDQVAAAKTPSTDVLVVRPWTCDVAVVVELDLAADQVRAGIVADRDEHAGDGELGLFAGDGVAQAQAGDLGLALDLGDRGVGQER